MEPSKIKLMTKMMTILACKWKKAISYSTSMNWP